MASPSTATPRWPARAPSPARSASPAARDRQPGRHQLSDGTIGTLSLTNAGNALTLGTGSGTSVLDMDIGSGTTDQIALGSGTLAMNGAW